MTFEEWFMFGLAAAGLVVLAAVIVSVVLGPFAIIAWAIVEVWGV